MRSRDEKILELLQKIDKGEKIAKEEIQTLEETRELYILDEENNITELPESIDRLTSLVELTLGFDKPLIFPKSFQKLSSLKYLMLCGSSFKILPKCIGQLTNLEYLLLFRTEITDLPEFIGKFNALRVLIITDETGIIKLPECIGQLADLRLLFLDGSGITELPEYIGKLSKLFGLSISNTKISTLPESIKQLSNLSTLNLKGTRITTLPEWIGNYPKLVCLDLSGLTLDKIPKSLALQGLPFIDVACEGIEIKAGINLHNTTLIEQDISVFLESPELIPGLYEKDHINLLEYKVIFLGDGDSGKSYTIQRFINKGEKESEEHPYPTKETPGVEIADCPATWEGTDFTIHFWDFGGQQLLHSMHRCFLTDKTCYVVTVKSRETKAQQRAYYWLKNVATIAPNSPVLLYVNCWDNDDGRRTIDENRLRLEFPQIKDVVYCSAKEAETAAFRTGFMDRLTCMAVRSDTCRQTVNRRWKEAKEAILHENRAYLTRERYHEICQRCGIEDDQASDLLTFFNNLGVCFSYHRDKDRKELADYKLLNPVWLTNAIYAIIEEGRASAPEGQIPDSAIEQMLCNPAPPQVDKKSYRRTVPDLIYKDFECEYILNVAAAYNLCYRVDPKTVFFPALCTNNTPVEALSNPEDYPQHVEYLLKYDYLPDSVVHQLVIRCRKKELVLLNCWLRGFMIGSMDVHKAIVRMEDDDKSLKIDLYSKPGHPVYELFELLREELKAVNEDHKLKPKELIVDGEDQYTVISLLNAAKDKVPVYGPTTGNKRSAEELLGNVYADWIIPWIRVENGSIIVPIVPREFHPCPQGDQALRYALYETYNHICPYCHQYIPNLRDMEVDHILPKHYHAPPQLAGYIGYLKDSGFDLEKPDYIENYFPAHSYCNRDISNYARSYSLIYWHEIALIHSKKVMNLIDKYKETT